MGSSTYWELLLNISCEKVYAIYKKKSRLKPKKEISSGGNTYFHKEIEETISGLGKAPQGLEISSSG